MAGTKTADGIQLHTEGRVPEVAIHYIDLELVIETALDFKQRDQTLDSLITFFEKEDFQRAAVIAAEHILIPNVDEDILDDHMGVFPRSKHSQTKTDLG